MNVINTQNIYTKNLDGIRVKVLSFNGYPQNDLSKQINQLTKAA